MTSRDMVVRMARDSFTQKSDTLSVQKHGLRWLGVAVFVITLAMLAVVRFAIGLDASLLASGIVFATSLALMFLEKSKK